MIKTLLVLYLILLASCVSQIDKVIPVFSLSDDELIRPVQEFRQSEYDMLFVLMVDTTGRIVRAKFLESKSYGFSKSELRRMEYNIRKQMKYSPKEKGEKDYRIIFHSIKYKSYVY